MAPYLIALQSSAGHFSTEGTSLHTTSQTGKSLIGSFGGYKTPPLSTTKTINTKSSNHLIADSSTTSSMANQIPATVSASLNYYQPPLDGSKPTIQTGSDKTKATTFTTNFSYEPKQVIIENVRGHENEYDLDTSGFLFYKHETKCKDFQDEATVQEVYFKESIELIKKVTGANRVVLFDHTIRKHNPEAPEGGDGVVSGPAYRVHIDQTPNGAVGRVHKHTSKELAPLLLKHRFQIINLWRPIDNPAFDSPLAVCDYRSLDWDKDLVPTDIKYTDNVGEVFYVNYNPQHKWKYQWGMRPDEVVFVKCFDSQKDGKTSILTPHSAFVDPTTPKDALFRESIEVRTLVFYNDLPNEA